jgi:hypothetical protein
MPTSLERAGCEQSFSRKTPFRGSDFRANLLQESAEKEDGLILFRVPKMEQKLWLYSQRLKIC